MASPRNRLLGFGLPVALVLALLFLWEVRVSVPATVDDAYITYTFSKNVALGNGPVYGHGVVVEGYSNFLWMLIVALGLLARPHANPTELAHLLALPFVFLMAFATYRLCRERAGALWSAAAATLVVINADVITGFQIGLETIPYTALLTLAFMLYVQSFRVPGLARWVVPAFVAVALMRIDGFLPLGFILMFEAVRRLSGSRAINRRGLREYANWALPALLVYALWFAWRWHTYGLPLPSTYYAKALIPKLLPDRGWQYVRDEFLANGSFLIVPFAVVLLARRSVRGAAMVLYLLGHVLYVVRVGGDWMPYGRFLLPILPLGLTTVVWGGEELAAALATRSRPLSRWVRVTPAAFLLHAALVTESHLLGSDLQRGKLGMAAAQVQHVEMLTTAAHLLNFALPPGARLVTDYGGVFAYFTDAAPIEMWGLCNATIATRGGVEGIQPIYGRTCPECYPELRPEFFHVMGPITRGLQAFRSHGEVVSAVWQTDTIGRYLNFRNDFVAGRVMIPGKDQAVYFLERRRPDSAYRARTIQADVMVDYPFEPGGRAAGL